MDNAEAVRWMAVIVCAGQAISAAEMLVARSDFGDTGLMSWPISRLHGHWSADGVLSNLLNKTLRYENFRFLMTIRLVASCMAFVLLLIGYRPIFLVVIVTIAALAINVRCPFGLDGAHQMTLIVLSGVCTALFWPNAAGIALGFVALQACLAYLVAGLSKLSSQSWRSGSALPGIAGTLIYGHPSLSSILAARPLLSRVLCWSTIVFECTFPLLIWLCPESRLPVLAAGIFFHVGIAAFMGLNGFLFAFIATYPALLSVHR